MGMDLYPIDPTDDAPVDDFGVVAGHYNWSGWAWLIEHLQEWGVDTDEFSGSNDGEIICKETCLAVAAAIKANLHTLSAEDQEWLKQDIILWETCGGYEQW